MVFSLNRTCSQRCGRRYLGLSEGPRGQFRVGATSGFDDVFHLARKLRQAERFRQKIDVAGGIETLPQGLLRVTRNEYNFEIGLALAHRRCQSKAA